MENEKLTQAEEASYAILGSLLSGAAAATICDIIFFPLDTIKTRLQSQHGLKQSGGFKNLYYGVTPVLAGSAPAASLFFLTYEGLKEILQPQTPPQYHTFIYMMAASYGEMAACLVRTPVEAIKQRKQMLLQKTGRLPLKTLYHGYTSTVLRDMPFGLLKMTIWEYLKERWEAHVKHSCTPTEGACCGAIAVALSAGITTPLDVAKTRITLSKGTSKEQAKLIKMLKHVYQTKGTKGLFAGFIPRVCVCTSSGFVFFGIYELFVSYWHKWHTKDGFTRSIQP